MWRSPWHRAREFFGAPEREAAKLWSALVCRVHKTKPCSSAFSPAGAPATWPTEEAAVRLTGAHVALGAASVLVLMLFPGVEELHHHGVLAVYAIVLLGCAAVLLSPAHRAVADLARKISRVLALHSNTALRWVGFTCIVLYAVCAVGDVRPEEAAAAKEGVIGLVLFPLFLVGVWTVSLSMVTEEEHEAGEVDDDGTAALAALDDDVAKVYWPENEGETSIAC